MYNVTQSEISDLIAFVKVNYGIDLTNKQVFLELRAQKSMMRYGFDRFQDCFNFICSDLSGRLLADFISSLTVNYTLFYRESSHFEYLKNVVLPNLSIQENATKDIRIWSAGCATGEEPYTIAMVLSDYFNLQKPFWDTKLLATDISTTALHKASIAQYPLESISALNPSWIKYYFIPMPGEPDVVQIAPQIKSDVIFRKHNLVASPFQFKKKFHVIFCRNVMIYFDEKTKLLLLNRFYDALENGGYLFVGASESIEKDSTSFQYIQPTIYQKPYR